MEKQSSAAMAAQQVEAIVAAAEATAREIEENARTEAAAHVAGAKDAVGGLVEQATALRARMEELEAAILEMRATVDAMVAEANATASTAAAPVGPIHPEPPAPIIEPVEPEPEPDEEPEEEPEPEETEAEVQPEAEPLEPGPKPTVDGARASEGARLIALNMALSGTPREETARYLRENFELDDPEALLDDVYARAGS